MVERSAKRRDLTLDKVVEAALAILRTEDEAALTMRRVARDLGVTPMALYHHLPDKDALLNAAVDQVFLDAARAAAPQEMDWRDELSWFMSEVRDPLVASPGIGQVFVRQPVLGPGTALTTERMFRLLRAGGVTGDALAEAVDSITLLTIGSIANEISRPAEVRLQLPGFLEAPEVLPDHIDTYARRDGRARYLQALTWLMDGIETKAGISPNG